MVELATRSQRFARVRDIFGLAKGWKIATQKMKDELRRIDREKDKRLM